jgi:hypothetical protein
MEYNNYMERQQTPIWIFGVLIALVLIVVSSRGGLGLGNAELSQHFARQPLPTGPNISLPQLDFAAFPPALQEAARDLRRTLGLGGPGKPLEPLVETPSLLVEITELAPIANGIAVRGTITNRSTQALTVPISAFELRDSAGASYIASGGASATLRPGENTPLELTVPLPDGLGLLLITNLPPDLPVEQRLIAADQ